MRSRAPRPSIRPRRATDTAWRWSSARASSTATCSAAARELYDAGAILVNRNGERFADEAKPVIYELAYQPDALAYIVFDGAIAEQFRQWPHYISTAPGIAYAYLQDYEKTRPDLVRKADTLE